MHWWPHFTGSGGWVMVIFWLLIVVGIVWVIAYFLRDQNWRGEKKEDPYEIARLRYSRGEIKKEELEEIIKNLNEQRKN